MGFLLLKIAVAVVAAVVIIRIGSGFVYALSGPPEAPPDPGQLRKVRITFRCSLCGTEVRMTQTNSDDPEPPKHCMEEMDVVATADI